MWRFPVKIRLKWRGAEGEGGGWLEIPPAEVRAEYARASGPGGQHVNKTETRVTLRFSVRDSAALPPPVKALLLQRLSPRLTKAGELLVSAEKHRERTRNVADAYERMQQILERALEPKKPRRATSPSRGARARRLGEKREASERKRLRKKPAGED